MRPMIWAERFGKSFVRIESNNNIMKRIVTVAVIALFLFFGGGTAHAQSEDSCISLI